MILAWGQSNAEPFVAGPRPDAALLQDPRVVTLTRGSGLRGEKYLPDGTRKTTLGEFFHEGKRLLRDRLGELHPMCAHENRNSSILHAAGACLADELDLDHVYVRAAAKGGMRLVGKANPKDLISGIYKDHLGQLSPLFTDVIENAETFVAIARARGEALRRVYILFIHGEADRSTPTEAYLAQFTEAKARIDAALRARGLDPHWLVTQTGGTDHRFGGNDWSSRLAARAFQSGGIEDLTFLAALHPYALEDHIHHDARAKALIGELAARAIARLEGGQPWQTPRVTAWERSGACDVTLQVATPEPLQIDETHPYENLGFTVAQNAANPVRSARLVEGDRIHVAFTHPITTAIRLGYAYRRREPGMPVVARAIAFGGGQIRTGWRAPSRLIEGVTLHKWLPGFLAEIEPADAGGRLD